MNRAVRAIVLAAGALSAIAGIAMVGVAWFAFPVQDPAVAALTIGAFPMVGVGSVALLAVVAADRRGRRN